MEQDSEIVFLDHVRVRATGATEAAGLAGKVGEVTGFTTPSHMKVSVVGALKQDFAIGVRFEDHDDTIWFAEDQLELIDHAAGTTIQVKGDKNAYVKTEAGGWKRIPGSEQPRSWFARVRSLFYRHK